MSIALLIVTAITRVREFAKLALLLSRAQQVFQLAHRGIESQREIDRRLAIVATGAARYVHQSPDVIAVRIEKLKVALDVCAEHSGGAVLGENPGQHHRARFLNHRANDLLHQLALAGEVVGNHALADAGAFGNLGQRGLGVSEFRNRVDRAFDDLRAPRNLDK